MLNELKGRVDELSENFNKEIKKHKNERVAGDIQSEQQQEKRIQKQR